MDRLTIFAKGNLDVRDTLHALRVGGELRWNGVNEVVRPRHPSTVVRVRHETLARSDQLVAAEGHVPAALAGATMALGPYPLASQYGRTLFDTPADAYVAALQVVYERGSEGHESGLGLVRIAYEGGCRVTCRTDGDGRVTVRASRAPRAALDAA